MAPIAHFPFQLYCKQLIAVFKKAKTNSNPALFLYKNNARKILFMAESILRASNKLFEDKEIKDWHATIKKLENYLGDIDAYFVLLSTVSKLKTVNLQQLEYISNKLDRAVEKLNEKLQKNDFYFTDINEMNLGFKINFNDKKIISKLHEEIKSELFEACEFFNQFEKGFDDMESEVHELRRKLRWISIYGESFQGLMLLQDGKENYKWEKEFITKVEVQNPFNTLPIKKNLTEHILLNKKAFYALSFVIRNLGTIKEKSYTLYYLDKSIRKTTVDKIVNSELLAAKQLNAKYTQASLLKEAHILLNTYFNKYKIHQTLI